jgi:lipopolysaccharide export system protein LptC
VRQGRGALDHQPSAIKSAGPAWDIFASDSCGTNPLKAWFNARTGTLLKDNRLAIAYPENAARGLSTKPRGDFERSYRSALRHSRHVLWLRIGVPAGIAGLLLTVAALNYMPPIGGFRLPGELGNLVIHGTKITMEAPRLTGFTADSRAYEFSANAAAQDMTKPDLVELQKLHAKMEMADKTTVEMSAVSGVYNVKSEILTLNENIDLLSSSGYSGHLSEAVVDVKKGSVVSDKPVQVNMLNGSLNAQHLDIADNGSVLRFTTVEMTLQPGKDGDPKASDQ